MLPLWGTVLLSIGWLNRHSRSALLTELTSWVIPLVVTDQPRARISMGFRVTPSIAGAPGRLGWFLGSPDSSQPLNLANSSG